MELYLDEIRQPYERIEKIIYHINKSCWQKLIHQDENTYQAPIINSFLKDPKSGSKVPCIINPGLSLFKLKYLDQHARDIEYLQREKGIKQIVHISPKLYISKDERGKIEDNGGKFYFKSLDIYFSFYTIDGFISKFNKL